MKNVFDEVVWYALGRKGNKHHFKHGVLKENVNVTNVQEFLAESLTDKYYVDKLKSLINRK